MCPCSGLMWSSFSTVERVRTCQCQLYLTSQVKITGCILTPQHTVQCTRKLLRGQSTPKSDLLIQGDVLFPITRRESASAWTAVARFVADQERQASSREPIDANLTTGWFLSDKMQSKSDEARGYVCLRVSPEGTITQAQWIQAVRLHYRSRASHRRVLTIGA